MAPKLQQGKSVLLSYWSKHAQYCFDQTQEPPGQLKFQYYICVSWFLHDANSKQCWQFWDSAQNIFSAQNILNFGLGVHSPLKLYHTDSSAITT